MSQVASAMNVLNLNNAAASKPVRFWRDPIEFATFLAALKGPQFMAYDARFDMTAKGKMLVKSRVDKTPNPFLVSGLFKEATTQVTVAFDYQKKVESRGGEYSGKGSWSQCVVIDGLPSCLSTHKDDCTLNADGTLTFKDNPRLYLRCEIVRSGDGETRAEKDMRSKSRYVLPDGTEVAYEKVEPYLPAQSERKDETDMITVTLSNIVELRAGGVVWRQWKGENALAALNAAVAK